MQLSNILIDDEFKALCPPLTEEERSELAVSISREGFRDSLVVWGKILIDGHNRYELWSLLYADDEEMKPPSIVQRDFKDRNAVIEWIIRNQFGRRNLTHMQRAELALRLKSLFEKRGKENQKSRKGNQPGATLPNSENLSPINTQKELAKIAGVSGDTISKVETILNSGDEETANKVRKGEMSINAAAKAVKQGEVKLQATEEKPRHKLQGVGVIRAQEAVDCLKRIPPNDPLRESGFKIVRDWMRLNK